MSLTPRLADNSWFAIAKQIDCDTPIINTTQFVQHRYPFTSLDIDLESELQASDAIAGTRSDTKDQQGQLWGNGSFETQLYIDKMDTFWQAIINSENPKKSSKPPTIINIDDTEILTNTTFAQTITAGSTIIETPGQLQITLTSTDPTNNPLPTDTALGTVDIYGQRRVGLGTNDMLPMKETELAFTNGTAKSENYFAKIDKVVFSKQTLDHVEIDITAKPDQTTSIYKNRDEIFPGWTMQLVRGNVPTVVEGAVPTNTTLTIGENIRLSMDILARKISPYREIGSDADAPIITNDLKDLDFITDTFYPNWGGLLEVEGTAIVFTNLTLNINQNLDFLPGIKASRYRLPVAPTGEKRNVTLTATVYYDTERWSEVFRDNVPRQLIASCYYWDEMGKQYSQRFSLPVGYLTTSPRVGIDSRGPMTRELSFKAVPASTTAPDEIEISIAQ